MAADFGSISSFIWGTADLIRDSFRLGHYQDVILPMTVLRRLDCVLAPTHDKVQKRYAQLEGKVENLYRPLTQASGYAFYNVSKFTFGRLLDDPPNVALKLRSWINGFSENMLEVLQKFDFDNTISKLDEADLLYLVVQRFHEVDLHPDTVDNHTMGLMFEDLIRHFGYRKITVERPLRLSFQITEERIATLEREKAFERLATSPKKGAAGREEIEEKFILALARGIRERSTEFRYGDFKELTLPIPDEEEQERISTFLDREVSKIDALIQTSSQSATEPSGHSLRVAEAGDFPILVSSIQRARENRGACHEV